MPERKSCPSLKYPVRMFDGVPNSHLAWLGANAPWSPLVEKIYAELGRRAVGFDGRDYPTDVKPHDVDCDELHVAERKLGPTPAGIR